MSACRNYNGSSLHGGRFWASAAKGLQKSFDRGMVLTKDGHDLGFDLDVADRVLRFWIKEFRRLNPDHIFFPAERRPLQEIDFFAPQSGLSGVAGILIGQRPK